MRNLSLPLSALLHFRGSRTRAATGVPTQPNVFYAAQVNGGVWKSTDAGRAWSSWYNQPTAQLYHAIATSFGIYNDGQQNGTVELRRST